MELGIQYLLKLDFIQLFNNLIIYYCSIPLFVLVASAAVTVILIGNLVVSLVCVCSAAAIFLGIFSDFDKAFETDGECVFAEAFCISALMGVILNPFSAAFLVVVAALSVKSSTHICYSFQQVGKYD